mmetsp:Transcript_87574/g.167967  ORF Transcript_87574/g.167967 Transcript_87574/m.167967 type:complete len:325 (+) Transcript_87574:3734-4708(+)
MLHVKQVPEALTGLTLIEKEVHHLQALFVKLLAKALHAPELVAIDLLIDLRNIWLQEAAIATQSKFLVVAGHIFKTLAQEDKRAINSSGIRYRADHFVSCVCLHVAKHAVRHAEETADAGRSFLHQHRPLPRELLHGRPSYQRHVAPSLPEAIVVPPDIVDPLGNHQISHPFQRRLLGRICFLLSLKHLAQPCPVFLPHARSPHRKNQGVKDFMLHNNVGLDCKDVMSFVGVIDALALNVCHVQEVPEMRAIGCLIVEKVNDLPILALDAECSHAGNFFSIDVLVLVPIVGLQKTAISPQYPSPTVLCEILKAWRYVHQWTIYT